MREIMGDQTASEDKSAEKAGGNGDSAAAAAAAAAALSSSAAGARIASQGSGSSPSKEHEQPVESSKEKTESDSSPSDSATADDAIPSATAAGIESHESEISSSKMQPAAFIKDKPESESSPRKVKPVEVDSSPSKVRQVEKERRHESLAAVRAKAIQNAIILFSVVVALFILTTMVLSRGQPLQVASVWYVSGLICLCSFIWVWFLKIEIGAGMVFIFLTYGGLVAIVAHYTCGPKIGMLCVHLVTHLAASFVGYSIAGHWPKTAKKKTAKKNDIPLPENVQQAKKLQFLLLVMFFVTITVCATAAVVWIMYHADDYAHDELLLYVLMALLGILILWISYMDASISGEFLGQEGMAMVFTYYGLIITMYLISLVILGPTAAAFTTWIASLGMSGFFGFYLSICNSYK